MMEIEYHPEARQEVVDTFQWYSGIDEQLGERFKIELARAEAKIQRSPETWGRYLHDTQAFRFKGFPFVLAYIERDNQITIVALAHTRRRPGYGKTGSSRKRNLPKFSGNVLGGERSEYLTIIYRNANGFVNSPSFVAKSWDNIGETVF